MVSREEEPPHTSHHGAREISTCKNKEYKKAKRETGMGEKDRKRERTISRETELGETQRGRERGVVGEGRIGIERQG